MISPHIFFPQTVWIFIFRTISVAVDWFWFDLPPGSCFVFTLHTSKGGLWEVCSQTIEFWAGKRSQSNYNSLFFSSKLSIQLRDQIASLFCLMPSVFSKLSLLLNNFVSFFSVHTFLSLFSAIFLVPPHFFTIFIPLKMYQKFSLNVVLLWFFSHYLHQLIWSTAVCLFACIHSSHLTPLPLLTFRNHGNAKTWPALLQDGWASAFAFFLPARKTMKPQYFVFFSPACVSNRHTIPMVEMSRLLQFSCFGFFLETWSWFHLCVMWTWLIAFIVLYMHPSLQVFPPSHYVSTSLHRKEYQLLIKISHCICWPTNAKISEMLHLFSASVKEGLAFSLFLLKTHEKWPLFQRESFLWFFPKKLRKTWKVAPRLQSPQYWVVCITESKRFEAKPMMAHISK